MPVVKAAAISQVVSFSVALAREAGPMQPGPSAMTDALCGIFVGVKRPPNG